MATSPPPIVGSNLFTSQPTLDQADMLKAWENFMRSIGVTLPTKMRSVRQRAAALGPLVK